MEQYRKRLDFVISQIQEKLPKYMGWKFLDNEIKAFKDEHDISSKEYDPSNPAGFSRPYFAVHDYNRNLQQKWTAFQVRMDNIVRTHQESGMFERIEVVDKALEAMKTPQNESEGNYKSIIEEIEATDRV